MATKALATTPPIINLRFVLGVEATVIISPFVERILFGDEDPDGHWVH